MVPPNLTASTPPRLSRRPTAQGERVECVDDRHGRRPPSPSQCSRPSRLCRREHASLRAGPPPPGRSADHESAPTSEGRLVATRAGGAGYVGSISGWGKRTATPMSARQAAKSDRVDDALIGRRQRLNRRRRNRNAAVVENRPSPGMPRAANARPSLSGASLVAVPVTAPYSPRHGDERAACADARHGRRLSPSSTEPTVPALPPRACIAPSRPSPSGAER